ncbi:hypothetical protein J1N35_005762 [Gossypium stocksii]|uniref:RNase H type-1 domain-containing protein n=1 Tax=Gossypium stocksii TaxID=47602 RepID=A0A9D3WF83_9ROSI|nr:hypothetical protein J1N35_005762 [Gossypium stocksii]
MGPLVCLIPGHSNMNMDCMLSDMVSGNGEWNIDLFHLWLLEDIIRRIAGIPPPHSIAGVDRIICKGVYYCKEYLGPLNSICLTLLCEHDFGNVLIETDNLEAVKAIQERTTNGSNSALIGRIHQLLLRFEQWNVCHIPREDNKDANRMVELAHLISYDLFLYEVSPLWK